jgi:hypothetical protein
MSQTKSCISFSISLKSARLRTFTKQKSLLQAEQSMLSRPSSLLSLPTTSTALLNTVMASPDTNPPPLRIGFLKLVPADAPAASTRRERRDRAAAQRAATGQGGSPPHLRADGGEGRSRGRGGRGGRGGARRDYSTSAAAVDTATTMTTSSSSSVSSSHLQQQNPRSGGGGGFAFPIIRRSSPVLSSSLPPQAQSDLQRRLNNLPPIPPASSSQQQARQPRKPRIDPFASYPQFDYRTQYLDPSKDTPMLYYARTVEEANEALAKLGPG